MWNSYNQENGNTEKCTLSEHGLVKDYSTGGRPWGHPMLGVMMVEEMVNEHFKETNPQKVKLLEHIIASHHGTPEFGAAVYRRVQTALSPVIPTLFWILKIATT